MPWSNFNNLNKNETEDQAEIKSYQPKIFTLKQSEIATNNYMEQKKKGSDFVMSDVVKKISGIEGMEKAEEFELIETKVDEKVKQIEKNAYDEAYKLGLEQGKSVALEEKKQELDSLFSQFENLLKSIENIKLELIHQNEAHIVRSVYHIAQKIAYDHIQQNPELVLEVIKKSVAACQSEENIVLTVSPEQEKIIEDIKKLSHKEFDFLKNLKIETSADIAPGGCVVETNYSKIDAQVEKRVENIWNELEQAIPKIKKVAG